MEEVLRAPGTEAWPGENEPEVMKAMEFIGKTTILGADPRYSYWHKIETESEAARALKEAGAVTFEEGEGFRRGDFAKAMNYLKVELTMVAKARGYEAIWRPPPAGANRPGERPSS